jgi:hypothetical protein
VIIPPFQNVPSYEQLFLKLEALRVRKRNAATGTVVTPTRPLQATSKTKRSASESSASWVDNNVELEGGGLDFDEVGHGDIDQYHDSGERDMVASNVTVPMTIAVALATPVKTAEPAAALALARVSIIHRCIQRATGALGGNAEGGPIYGELTAGSMQNVIAFLVAECSFDIYSRFIDVGAGRGKPNLHVAQDPGVRLSIGIELMEIRWKVCI